MWGCDCKVAKGQLQHLQNMHISLFNYSNYVEFYISQNFTGHARGYSDFMEQFVTICNAETKGLWLYSYINLLFSVNNTFGFKVNFSLDVNSSGVSYSICDYGYKTYTKKNVDCRYLQKGQYSLLKFLKTS